MSADNLAYIQKQPDGKWWVWMGFASDDKRTPPGKNPEVFPGELEAYRFAVEMGTEYGPCVLKPRRRTNKK